MLNASYCPKFTDYGFHGLSSKNLKLTTLVIKGCKLFNDLALSYLGSFPITDLNISHCLLLSDTGIFVSFFFLYFF